MTRILLVEDSEDILFVFQTELEWRGYSVVTARDAVSGVDVASRIRPDVIVSDLHMPEIDGYEFIRQVRQIPELASLPAIALTGCAMKEDKEMALKAGFTAYLTKPVDAQTLSDMVTRLTQKCFKKAS
jgi:two-component system CheB/CheR fusion protein